MDKRQLVAGISVMVDEAQGTGTMPSADAPFMHTSRTFGSSMMGFFFFFFLPTCYMHGRAVRVRSSHVMPTHVVSHDLMSCRIMPCHMMCCAVVLCCAVLCCAMLRVMLTLFFLTPQIGQQ